MERRSQRLSFLYSSDGFYGGIDYRAFEQSVALDLDLRLRESGSQGKHGSQTTLTSGPLSESEKHVVFWNGEDDPENPMNWSAARKWTAVLIVSTITFVTPLASSMFAPAIPQIMSEFHSHDDVLSSFVVSIFVLGFAAGPLILAPLSELYGRNIMLNITNLLFVVFTVACAVSSNLNMLIVFRFLAGCVGAAPLTIGGGTIADVMPPEKRGMAMAVFVMGPLVGPTIGPVAGGFLAEAAGWRWIFWLVTLLSGLVTVCTFLFLKETYVPKLLEDKAIKLRKQTGSALYRSKLDTGLPARQVFIRAIVRPTKMMIFSPIVLGLSAFMATVYGYNYFLITTFPTVFQEQYDFTIGTIGLVYLGPGVGMLFGAAIVGVTSDKLVTRMAAKSGTRKAEYRLPLMIFGSPLIAIGLFWYGWSAEKKAHWIIPILGTVPFGAGLMFVFTPLSTYLIDCYTIYAASALAAATVARSVLGALLPLAGQSMYKSLGLGWGNSLLGFLALAFCAVPVAFWRWGEWLRGRFVLEL